jgi:hypothetical protein
MARFFGSSGCTAKLVRDLRDLGLSDVNTYSEIATLFDDIDSVIAKRRAHEEQLQRAEADAARAEVSILERSLVPRVRDIETKLACERDALPNEIENLASEISRQRLQGVLHIPRWFKLRYRHRKLTHHLEREARRPFRHDFSRIERLRRAAAEIERDLSAVVESRVAPYLHAKTYFESNRGWFLGAKGEETVLNALRALPDEFCVISDVFVDLGRSARWRARPGVRVQSAQIDHVVVGPCCAFLVETKNWSQDTADSAAFSPEEQVSRAAYIFYLLAQAQFGRRKMARRDVVVHLGDRSGRWRALDPPHQYVTQVPVGALAAFIRSQRRQPAPDAVTAGETEAWLLNRALQPLRAPSINRAGGYPFFAHFFRFSARRSIQRLWK